MVAGVGMMVGAEVDNLELKVEVAEMGAGAEERAPNPHGTSCVQ